MADNTEFSLDQSDLEKAIAQQLSSVAPARSTDQELIDNRGIGAVVHRGSSQAKMHSMDELEDFFKKEDERAANINYLDESYTDGDEEGDDDSAEANKDDDSDGQGDKDTKDQGKKEEGSDNGKDRKAADDKGADQDDQDGAGEAYLKDLLEIIREEGLLYIPDDFDGTLDADTMDDLKAQTRARMEDEILESVRARYADDPLKLQYFDYFIAGGPDADLPTYRSLVETVEQYRTFDVSKEDSQRMILEQYLKEGLDPNNPAHRMRLNKVKADVDEIMSSYEGEAQAKEARDYFVGKYSSLIDNEHQRIAQAAQQREAYELERQKAEMQWHNTFQRSLESSGWSQDKRRQILEEQYGEVKTQDGNYVPVWYAKEMMIKTSPELHKMYLDFLSGFDLQSGRFKNTTPVDETNKTTRKILELANRKQQRSPSHVQPTVNRRSRDGGSYDVVNPLDNL